MVTTDVRALVARGETYEVEFKSDPNDDAIVEAVVCLSNGDGGLLIIGVDDVGNVLGVPPRHAGGVAHDHRIVALVANKTAPALAVDVTIEHLNDKEVLVVHVPRSRTVVATTSGRYLRRATDVHGKPECRPMHPHEVQTRDSLLGGHDLSTLPLNDLHITDLDPGELDRFRSLAKGGGDTVLSTCSDRDLLAALGFLSGSDVPTLGAALVFGTQEVLERFAPTHEVVFQVLGSLDAVQVNRNLQVPLIKAMLDLVDAVQPYNPEDEVLDGLFRLGLPRYSKVAVRELIANALVHRDYSTRGQVRVAVEDTTLSVSSPGRFPYGITIDNLLTAPPQARNPRIAEAFKRAGLVERTGRGINQVYRAQLESGRSQPDYLRSNNSWVEVRLGGLDARRELAVFAAHQARNDRPLALSTLQILHEVWSEEHIATDRAIQLLQVSGAEARSILNKLVERGYLEARGQGRGRTYHCSPGLYQQIGEPAAYARNRGFTSIQQEQMVLTYVTAHGSIARSEAAELCRLTPDQASRLLRNMVEKNLLFMHGTRRTARYHPR